MANDGKVAEGLIQSALMKLEQTRKATWVRLYDSTSAGVGSGGNFIPPQPADFIVVTDKAVFILEVKSSQESASLLEKNVHGFFKQSQILGAKLWKRAGRTSYCAFYCLGTERFEFWDMGWIIDAYTAPPRKRKLKGVPIASCREAELVDIIYNVLT